MCEQTPGGERGPTQPTPYFYIGQVAHITSAASICSINNDHSSLERGFVDVDDM